MVYALFNIDWAPSVTYKINKQRHTGMATTAFSKKKMVSSVLNLFAVELFVLFHM